MKTEVYFATNRDSLGTEDNPRFGNRFHKDGPHFYRVGAATVEKVSDDPDAGYQLRRIKLRPESGKDASAAPPLLTPPRPAGLSSHTSWLFWLMRASWGM